MVYRVKTDSNSKISLLLLEEIILVSFFKSKKINFLETLTRPTEQLGFKVLNVSMIPRGEESCRNTMWYNCTVTDP